eukprot:9399634-Pyramimonas_sp.AAC.1
MAIAASLAGNRDMSFAVLFPKPSASGCPHGAYSSGQTGYIIPAQLSGQASFGNRTQVGAPPQLRLRTRLPSIGL